MNGLPTTLPIDVFFEGNGSWFFNTRPDERPRPERIDLLRSNEPSPDDEESWGMR